MTTITETFTLNNGVKMPKVGFGTWQTEPGQETYDAVANALKAGYRFLDTAKAYRNEKKCWRSICGLWLRPRSRFYPDQVAS